MKWHNGGTVGYEVELLTYNPDSVPIWFLFQNVNGVNGGDEGRNNWFR